MNQEIIITVGLPASGKSSFAQDIIKQHSNYVEINRESIRKELFNIEGWSEYNCTPENEQLVSTKEFDDIRSYINSGKSVIVTDSNIRLKYIKGLIHMAKCLNVDARIKLMDTPLLDIIQRNSERLISHNINDVKSKYDTYLITRQKVINNFPDLVM